MNKHKKTKLLLNSWKSSIYLLGGETANHVNFMQDYAAHACFILIMLNLALQLVILEKCKKNINFWELVWAGLLVILTCRPV